MTLPTWLLLALLWTPLTIAAGTLWWWALNTHHDGDTLQRAQHERAALARASRRHEHGLPGDEK